MLASVESTGPIMVQQVLLEPVNVLLGGGEWKRCRRLGGQLSFGAAAIDCFVEVVRSTAILVGFSDEWERVRYNSQVSACFTADEQFVRRVGDIGQLPGLADLPARVLSRESQDNGTQDLDAIVVGSMHLHGDRNEV